MYDVKLILNSLATAQTATGFGKDENGDAIVLDLCNGKQCKWQGRFIVRVDRADWDIHSPSQCYHIYLLGGSTVAFANQVVLSHIEVGAAICNISNLKLLTGRYEMLVQNEYKAVIYPFVRTYHVISGQSPHLLYRANLGKLY